MKILPKRKSIRFKNYDYSSGGYYFITICTQNRKCLFGDIVNEKMRLNDVGKMINQWYLKIPQRFTNVILDKYQIMPNHIHGIIVINDNKCVGARFPRLHSRSNGRENSAPTATLGQIVAYFKYQSTKQINNHFVRVGILPPNTIKKIWQRNYYEHIIRTQTDLDKIRAYIENNPKMWNRDRNNPSNWNFF